MKIHLLFKKEELDETKLDDSKTVVIFDILLATSTISACLSFGARAVIPTANEDEAREAAKSWPAEEICVAGEWNGLPIDDFSYPLPLSLKQEVANKTLILSTTNGTVAIRKAAAARKVWIASLLNGPAVAGKVHAEYEDETILLVCAGSANQFCLEDFYGAGYFLSELIRQAGKVQLTDSALSAKLFYESQADRSEILLAGTKVGGSLLEFGLGEDLYFVSQKNQLETAPYLSGNQIICDRNVSVYNT
ncbi:MULTISPECIES: 2-phosphosulfolactate phosphatase [unclassified Sporosarcina]|uniref:2-phosphosulfolactate phosphatase n=1 Tax=unclassified Sporosarcina TaxID=2647733 RepID=UPI00203DB079|nr:MULTISPECIES: 2-phosphosulfolactate phosphatase [unclassified Sporosarcina]GKV66139.1 putative 2-phosphosulfolactate phosphatase [Sporosarcina sp. NCCP-2331]GLB56103.1 putative 2-phosphosulfolactate phosphatase [Sporosarcina sp. NCCP-2378]